MFLLMHFAFSIPVLADVVALVVLISNAEHIDEVILGNDGALKGLIKFLFKLHPMYYSLIGQCARYINLMDMQVCQRMLSSFFIRPYCHHTSRDWRSLLQASF